ncbi:MAG TPA: glycosyltransferase family 39 protein [Bryobacteraceae bacterium]|nr:glycosyltransferase family 39 protein [Bryobacteraceae bacterium]
MVKQPLLIVALVILLRLPFLTQPIQGDDVDYLYGAEHAQIDPLHPLNTRYMFSGDLVDMRGHSHGPANPWILAILLAAMGDVREVPFHLAYTLFSIIAALAAWSLARRFCERPFAATLLFIAVPAFVVNGNSFEADLPFLAFWMASTALFVRAVDKHSIAALTCSAIAGAFAGLTAYQAILLTPVLAVYLFQRRRNWYAAWPVILAAPFAIAAWQFFEWYTRGALPAAVLMGYMRSYSFNKSSNTLRSAVALVVHSGWIVSPLLVIAAFWPKQRWRMLLAAAAMLAAAIYDVNPLFWLSVGCGVLILTWLAAEALRGDFLALWAVIFFAGALIIFFAGSARYLLPMAAPIAILTARSAPSTRWLMAGFALQLALSLALATANYQHWDGYRQFAKTLAPDASQRRVWVDAEWGLRYYLESEGALPLSRDQVIQPGDIVVSSELAHAVTLNAPVAQVSAMDIIPSVPLRLISLSRRSAYSSAAGGLLPFEISTGPVDRVRADTVVDRKPVLSYLRPQDPQVPVHILSGLFPESSSNSIGWMSERASVLLVPKSTAVEVVIYIPQQAPARHVQLLVDGTLVAEDTFNGPGAYKLSAPFQTSNPTATVTVTVDKTFTAPGDRRNLGVVITGIGFR